MIRTAEDARVELVRLLDLEPMGTQPDGVATWDDVVAYVAKALGTKTVAMETVRRRHRAVADALGVTHETPWPVLIERIRHLSDLGWVGRLRARLAR